jgi:hypothetical protein
MAYVQRNQQGKIIAIFESKNDDATEELAIDSVELIEYLTGSTDSSEAAKVLLNSSDYSLIRVIEDIVTTLVDKKLILFTDLPLAAQDKLSNRQKVRGHVSDLQNLMDDSEQGLL